MDKQKTAARSSRFNEPTSNTQRRTASAQSSTTRRPSGFGTAGRTVRSASAANESKKTAKAASAPIKESKPPRKEREPGKNRPVLRALLIIVIIAIIVSILMVLIFGGENTTYHQLPIIERESAVQFEPEETPISDTEGL